MVKDETVHVLKAQVKQFFVQFHTEEGGRYGGFHLFKQQAEAIAVKGGRTKVEGPVGDLQIFRKTFRLPHGVDK
jgi:hypothetical protein